MIFFKMKDGDIFVECENVPYVGGWFHIAVTGSKCFVDGVRHYVGITPIRSWPEWKLRNLRIERLK